MSEHLSELSAAAFVDGSLSRDERDLVQQHLAECAACRGEVVEVARMVRPRRRIARPLIPAVAAAAVVVIVLATSNKQEAPRPVLRGAVEAAAIRTVTPRDNQVVSPVATLMWQRTADANEYRLTVTNAAGDVVAEKITRDTSAVLQLARGAAFRWFVTAILRDGSTAASEVRSFRTK